MPVTRILRAPNLSKAFSQAGQEEITANKVYALGAINLAANTDTNVFQGSSKGNLFTLNIVNRNASSATFRLGISTTSATFDSTKYYEYDVVIPSAGVIIRSELMLPDSTYYVVARSSVADVTILAYGILS